MAKHMEVILNSLNRYIASSNRNDLTCVSWQKLTESLFSVCLQGVVRFRSRARERTKG